MVIYEIAVERGEIDEDDEEEKQKEEEEMVGEQEQFDEVKKRLKRKKGTINKIEM